MIEFLPLFSASFKILPQKRKIKLTYSIIQKKKPMKIYISYGTFITTGIMGGSLKNKWEHPKKILGEGGQGARRR